MTKTDKIANLLGKIRETLGKEGVSGESILFDLKNLIMVSETDVFPLKQSIQLKELLSITMESVKNKSGDEQIIFSGFSSLDEIAGGFFHGELIIIGGRPGMGKTQFLVNIVQNVSKKHPVLYYSFDLSGKLLSIRFLSAFSGISPNKILKNELSDNEKSILSEAYKKLEKHLIFLYDSGQDIFQYMKEQIKDHVKTKGVEVVVVDYLQLMSDNRSRSNRDSELSNITRELKNLAKELNICIIAASQLSRAVEYRGGNKRPQLSDLRDSGTIEQDSDKVIFIYRPEYYQIDTDEFGLSTRGITELIVAKNRTGSLGTANLLVDLNFAKFSEFNDADREFRIIKNRLDDLKSPF